MATRWRQGTLLLRRSDFHLRARVYTQDGNPVGDLERVLIDREKWEMSALVVKETRSFGRLRFHPGTALLKIDIVVPLTAISQLSRDRIDLSLSAKDVRKLPPYLGFAPSEPHDPTLSDGLAVEVAVLGGALMVHPLVATLNKPVSEIEVTPGESVMLGHDGHKFGKLRDVILDDGELAGIVVKPIGLFEHDVVVPTRCLERSDGADQVRPCPHPDGPGRRSFRRHGDLVTGNVAPSQRSMPRLRQQSRQVRRETQPHCRSPRRRPPPLQRVEPPR